MTAVITATPPIHLLIISSKSIGFCLLVFPDIDAVPLGKVPSQRQKKETDWPLCLTFIKLNYSLYIIDLQKCFCSEKIFDFRKSFKEIKQYRLL